MLSVIPTRKPPPPSPFDRPWVASPRTYKFQSLVRGCSVEGLDLHVWRPGEDSDAAEFHVGKVVQALHQDLLSPSLRFVYYDAYCEGHRVPIPGSLVTVCRKAFEQYRVKVV